MFVKPYILFFLSQNILELKVCDEDNITEDDHLLTVFFDVSKIQLGENIQLSFQLNPQVWIKFKDKPKGMYQVRMWLSELSSHVSNQQAFLSAHLATWVCPSVSGVDAQCCFCNYYKFWVLLLQTELANGAGLVWLWSLMSE